MAVGATNNLRGLAANIKFIEDMITPIDENVKSSLPEEEEGSYFMDREPLDPEELKDVPWYEPGMKATAVGPEQIPGKIESSRDAMQAADAMRDARQDRDRLMEDGGSAAWVKNQKRIEVLRQQMKRDPETIQKRNERDLQTEGTESAQVRVPKKKAEKKVAPVSESKPILAKQDLRKNLLHFFSAMEEEAEIRRVMLKHAKKKIFLCDKSKIGRSYSCVLCRAEDVDQIITEDT